MIGFHAFDITKCEFLRLIYLHLQILHGAAWLRIGLQKRHD